jgi:predicted membrane protein (TIGR00267 family)
MAKSPPHEELHHTITDPHRSASWLVDVVLGGQDGVVNVLGVVLGVAAATGNARVVLVAGLATAFAEAVSMAAVAYTSSVTRGEVFDGERAREYRHLNAAPALERNEIREIYLRKGFTGDLLERVVDTITSNPDVWVAVMMLEEHGLVRVDKAESRRSASVVGLASLLGSLLPLGPFLLLGTKLAALLSLFLATAALFAAGAYKGHVTLGRPLKSGVQLAAIGMLSALVGSAVGALFHVTP